MIDKGDYFQLEPGEKLPDSVKSALFIIADGIEGGCHAYIDVENHKTYIVCGEAKYLGFRDKSEEESINETENNIWFYHDNLITRLFL